jgi:5'-3' exonuclease
VFGYYYEGVPSWDWFYPYHYAPLAIDLINSETTEFPFAKGIPYNPVE